MARLCILGRDTCWWVGGDYAALTEPALSQRNYLKADSHQSGGPRKDGISYFTKETGAQWEYTARWQTNKPYVSIGESQRLPWCSVVADHDDLSTGDALSDPD